MDSEYNQLLFIIINKQYFKMKKLVIFISILSVFFSQSYGQNSYHIKAFIDKGIFIYPPYSKLKLNCKNTAIKSKFNFQYIYIDSIKMENNTYYSVLNELVSGKHIQYFTSSYPIENICFDTEYYGCHNKNSEKLVLNTTDFKIKKRKPNSRTRSKYYTKPSSDLKNDDNSNCGITTGLGTNYKIKYSFDQKALLLQIDYGRIINNQTTEEITNAFLELSKNLLIEFSKHEKKQSDSYDWPSSLSQNLVEKIFELIPIPQEASLARYISQIDEGKSFVLLNPKIKLKIDAVEKVKDGNNWYFNLLGTTLITINRNNEGQIIQNPFHKFQVNGMPNNIVKDKTVLQASTEDIQLSESLKECPFVFIWQNNLKQNNKASQPGSCDDAETDLINCNSQLWHFDKLNSFYTTDGTNDLDYGSVKYISSYGSRNLITPAIDIIVNGNLIQCPLGSSLNQLRNLMVIPLSIKFYRFWNNRYVKINNIDIDNLLLLPNDKIIF
jgi:hypothetical protein